MTDAVLDRRAVLHPLRAGSSRSAVPVPVFQVHAGCDGATTGVPGLDVTDGLGHEPAVLRALSARSVRGHADIGLDELLALAEYLATTVADGAAAPADASVVLAEWAGHDAALLGDARRRALRRDTAAAAVDLLRRAGQISVRASVSGRSGPGTRRT
jgi:hypothetical protein